MTILLLQVIQEQSHGHDHGHDQGHGHYSAPAQTQIIKVIRESAPSGWAAPASSGWASQSAGWN